MIPQKIAIFEGELQLQAFQGPSILRALQVMSPSGAPYTSPFSTLTFKFHMPVVIVVTAVSLNAHFQQKKASTESGPAGVTTLEFTDSMKISIRVPFIKMNQLYSYTLINDHIACLKMDQFKDVFPY